MDAKFPDAPSVDVFAPDAKQPDGPLADAGSPDKTSPDAKSCTGATFVKMASPTKLALEDVWVGEPKNVYVVGSGGMWRFDGKAWSKEVLPAGVTQVDAVWGTGSGNVFAVASPNILHYNGSKWTKKTPVFGASLRAVWGSGPKNVLVIGNDWFKVGGKGIALRYNGATWTKEKVPTYEYLYDVWVDKSGEAFAVGGSPFSKSTTILRYSKSKWTSMMSAGVWALTTVWGSGPSDVFAAGTTGGGSNPGTVLHFNGVSWKALTGIPAPSGNSFYDIWGTGPSNVYLVRSFGSIVHFNGKTFSNQGPSGKEWIGGVSGSGPNYVMAVGDKGGIYRRCP